MVADLSLLFSGMYSDELDAMGHRHQVVAGWQLNCDGHKVLGRARTVLIETVATDDENIVEGLGFLGRLDPGDVLVVSGSPEFAYFGELMSRLSMRQGLAGAIIDGLTRDSAFTRQIPLPVFARGYSPVDIKGRGRVAATDVEIEIGGVSVSPGDTIFGDNDAIVVIPQALREAVQSRVDEATAHEEKIIGLIDEGASVDEILAFTKGF